MFTVALTSVVLLITSFCFFRVSNKYSVNTIFGRDIAEAKVRNKHKRLILETVERLVLVRPEMAGG